MTWSECVNKLININGGWWVRGNNEGQYPIGYRLEQNGHFMTVIGYATHEDAVRDCENLGLPMTRTAKYY